MTDLSPAGPRRPKRSGADERSTAEATEAEAADSPRDGIGTRPADSVVFASLDDPLARPLIDGLAAEYERRYGEFIREAIAKGEPDEMQMYPPLMFRGRWGAAVLILRDGTAIAGGAFMHVDRRTVEYKRIWTDAAHRGERLSVRVLDELDAEAARRGYSRVYLTTGPRQPEARGLYLKYGFTPLFDADADPETVDHLAFEKRIVPARRRSVLTDVLHLPGYLRHQRIRRAAFPFRPPPEVRLDELDS